MDRFENVLCLCPSSRLTLASLVLSTWTSVRRFVLSEDDSQLAHSDRYSAIVVMDRFVTRPLIEEAARKLPVFVLAWNGAFEIELHRQALGELDVRFMGTEQVHDRTDMSGGYLPFINGRCSYTSWRELYRSKSQFRVVGSASYRARWLRTKLLRSRRLNVLVSMAGSLTQPALLRSTARSAVAAQKLVWAGNCFLDYRGLGFRASEQDALASRIESANQQPTPTARLEASLGVLRNWQDVMEPRAEPFPHVFYVTNTLLRWTVLGYLKATVPTSTWFFGKDNLGLGLERELYVHNLVPSEDVAFLELGGKTSDDGLYPRALHLLERQYYVIPISSTDGREIVAMVERLCAGVSKSQRPFFEELEHRRLSLYQPLATEVTLQAVQQRVWNDFEHVR